jgi:hypothetical protein
VFGHEPSQVSGAMKLCCTAHGGGCAGPQATVIATMTATQRKALMACRSFQFTLLRSMNEANNEAARHEAAAGRHLRAGRYSLRNWPRRRCSWVAASVLS